jgi:hypothetical protein
MATILILSGNDDPSVQTSWTESTATTLRNAGYTIVEGTIEESLTTQCDISSLILIGTDDPKVCSELIPPQHRNKTIIFAPGGLIADKLANLDDSLGFPTVTRQTNQIGLIALVSRKLHELSIK